MCPSTYCIKTILNQGDDQLCHVQEGGQHLINTSCASVCQNWKKSAIKRRTSCVHQQQRFQIVVSLSDSFSFCLCNLRLTLSVISASRSPKLTAAALCCRMWLYPRMTTNHGAALYHTKVKGVDLWQNEASTQVSFICFAFFLMVYATILPPTCILLGRHKADESE